MTNPQDMTDEYKPVKIEKYRKWREGVYEHEEIYCNGLRIVERVDVVSDSGRGMAMVKDMQTRLKNMCKFIKVTGLEDVVAASMDREKMKKVAECPLPEWDEYFEQFTA